jgi:hypothetical protein
MKMVGRVEIEAVTRGLEVRYGLNKRLTIQPLTGTPVATFARLCTTDSRKTHAGLPGESQGQGNRLSIGKPQQLKLVHNVSQLNL